MDIKVSKKDAIHILNWLNVFKHQCEDPVIGLHYLVNDIEEVRKNLFEECKPYFNDPKMCEDGHVIYGTKKEVWWMDKKYLAK